MTVSVVNERLPPMLPTPCDLSYLSNISPPDGPLSSLNSLISSFQEETLPEEGNSILSWLVKYIQGHYPLLDDVLHKARQAGFTEGEIAEALASDRFVIYESFPYRQGDQTHVRHVDDWPNDPCLRHRFRGQINYRPIDRDYIEAAKMEAALLASYPTKEVKVEMDYSSSSWISSNKPRPCSRSG